MSEAKNQAEAGPSKESEVKDADVEDTPTVKQTPKKGVRWDTKEEDPPSVREQSLTPMRSRRQSMVGTAGYVSQILEEYVEEDEPETQEEDDIKRPIRKQSLAERRESIKAVGVDMDYYMEEMLKPGKKKSERTKRFPKLISKEKLEEIISFSTMTATDSRENSKWSPTQLFREEPDTKQAVSWVGAYIVGKDYWTKKDLDEEKDEKVGYIADAQRRPWYEMPLKQTTNDKEFQKRKHQSLEKIEALKEGDFYNYDDLRKERLEYIRRETTPLEGLDEEFKLYFHDVCKSSDFLHREHCISMAELDKWLERAAILDYSRLTLINTGLCFIASGGNRHRGLTYDEFTQFLQMISLTTGKSMKEIVLKMQACQRAPKQEEE